MQSENLQNLFKVDRELYSGSSPDDEAGFAELKALGVTTIVSVDGTRPNVELAKKYGLKYVHLPIGYDGVPRGRVAELIKAANGAEGAVYMHCHHGKHRGPAAVAVVCQGLKEWDAETAIQWLKQAGTGDEYAGLYRDVRGFQAPDAGALTRLPKEFPEVARTPPLVNIMVSMDELFDRLKSFQEAAWTTSRLAEKDAPLQGATLLWELYREMARMEDTARHPEDYRAKLAHSEKAVEKLRTAMRAANPNPVSLDSAFQEIGQQCAACHNGYRNKKNAE